MAPFSVADDGPAVNPHLNTEQAVASEFFQALVREGEVHEVRVFSPFNTTGYLDDPEKLATVATRLSDGTARADLAPASAVHVTLNPVDPAFLDERDITVNGKVQTGKAYVGDAHVLHRRNLLIDVDPVRESDSNSTDDERDAAIALRDEIQTFLTGRGWPEPVVVAMSGNGTSLVYRIDLPNDSPSRALIEGVLRALSDRFGTDTVTVDRKVGNAARLTKVIGTVARKGEASDERPHRLAEGDFDRDAGTVSREQLAALGGPVKQPKRQPKTADTDLQASRAEAVRTALDTLRVEHRDKPEPDGRLTIILNDCLTSNEVHKDAHITVFADGGLDYGCFHNSCDGKRWGAVASQLGGIPKQPGTGTGTDDEDLNQAQVLLQLAQPAKLFHTAEGTLYASFPVAGHHECWPINNKGFRLWLTHAFYKLNKKPPSSQALQSALSVLEAQARFDGSLQTVHTRMGGHGGRIYLDLCNDRWEVVEIDAEGWRITTTPPIHFRRPKGMLALPEPTRGGSVDKLREFINVENDTDFILIVACLVGAFRPRGPYVALGLHGEPGSAKSTAARMLRALIDPNAAAIRSAPRKEEDLLIAGSNGWMPVFDNLSSIPEWLSDALCRLATGGGIGKRELYSDLDETILDVMRPTIVTGIGNLAGKPDLLDRSVLVSLPIIDDAQRVDEEDLWPAFEEARPAILGALLDAVSVAIRNRPKVKLDRKPRMADFAKWVEAAGPGLGWKEGSFLAAYTDNRQGAMLQSLEASPLVAPLRALLSKNLEERTWEGSAAELLAALATEAGEQATRQRSWPKAPHVLGTRLRELAGGLRRAGFEVDFGHVVSRTIVLRGPVPERGCSGSSVSSVSSEPDSADATDTTPQPRSGSAGAGTGAARSPFIGGSWTETE